MDYRRLFLAVTAQAGVFAAGLLALPAFGHGLYATCVLCLLTAALLAWLSKAHSVAGWGQDLLRRPGAISANYTAELSRRRLQVLLDQTPSALLLRSADGQVIAVNRAARKMFNATYALPVATRRKLLGEAGDIGRGGGQVTWQGATYALERTLVQGPDEVSELIVMSDISAELRAAEATALRDLLRILNHELMNALTPVASMSRSALDILKEDGPQAKTQAIAALERVAARTEGLTQFVNAYRELSRLPPPELRPVALVPWLDVTRESFAAQWGGQGVGLDIRAPENLYAIMDQDQMWQCAGNLLNNAAEAALQRTDPHVRLDIETTPERLVFRIQDSGPGIAPDQALQVFQPFYTTRAGGNGVGLSLARQIVQAHGGHLWLVYERRADDLAGACFAFDMATVHPPLQESSALQ